jgi:putative FmdB family regulatory protein
MPTYQYRCAKCGDQFEAWQSIHDDAFTVHDDCGGALAKVMTVGGIVLKGPGFYRNDSRIGSRGRDGKPADAPSGNGAGEKAAGSGDNDKGDKDKSGTEKSGTAKSDTKKADSSAGASSKPDRSKT